MSLTSDHPILRYNILDRQEVATQIVVMVGIHTGTREGYNDIREIIATIYRDNRWVDKILLNITKEDVDQCYAWMQSNPNIPSNSFKQWRSTCQAYLDDDPDFEPASGEMDYEALIEGVDTWTQEYVNQLERQQKRRGIYELQNESGEIEMEMDLMHDTSSTSLRGALRAVYRFLNRIGSRQRSKVSESDCD